MLSYAALLPPLIPNLPSSTTVPLTNITLPRTCRAASGSTKLTPSLSFQPQIFTYRIPNTFRSLIMCMDTDTPLNPAFYTHVISVIRARMSLHIETHGDGPLWPRDNPTSFNVPDCYLQVKAKLGLTPGSPLMTYGMVREVMDGLQDYLEQHAGYFEVFWDLEDVRQTILGNGYVVEKSPGFSARLPG